MRILFWTATSLLIVACGQTSPNVTNDSTGNGTVKIVLDNSEIYDVIQFIISSEDIDKKHGIKLTPISTEEYFLRQLTVDTLEGNPRPVDVKERKLTIDNISDIPIRPPQCLTNEDVNFMLRQMDILRHFHWDNSRLGFNAGDMKQWYEFSIPVFSEDSSKVVVNYVWRCDQFMCGRDNHILLTKDGGKWVTTFSPVVLH